jgi:hypothetical protein
MRAHRALLALALAGLLLGLPASAALAQPGPGTSPPGLPPPTQPVAPPSVDAKKGDQLTRQFEQSQVPLDPKLSSVPLSHYHVYYDEGGSNLVTKTLANATRGQGALGFVTDGLLAFAAVFIAWAIWLLTAAFTFRFANALVEPVSQLALAFNATIIGPLGLLELAGVLAGLYMMWQYLRGRLAHGVGEFIVSIVIVTLATALVPSALMTSMMNFTARSAGVVLVVGSGGDPNAISPPTANGFAQDQFEPYVRVYGRQLIGQYVARPAAELSWGTIPTGACAKQYDKILARGLEAADDQARSLMAQGGVDCKRHAEFATHPTWRRAFGAGVALFMAVVILLVALVIAGMVMGAQISAGVLVAFTYWAVVIGTIPTLREWLWRWCRWFIQAFVLMLLLAGVLVVAVIAGRAVTSATADWPAPGRAFVVALVPLAALLLVFKAYRHSAAVGHRAHARLSSARVGGSNPQGVLAPSTAAAGGIGVGAALQALRRGHQVARREHERFLGSSKKDGLLLGKRVKPPQAGQRAGSDTHTTTTTTSTTTTTEVAAEAAGAAAQQPPAGAMTKRQAKRARQSGRPVPKSLTAMAPPAPADRAAGEGSHEQRSQQPTGSQPPASGASPRRARGGTATATATAAQQQATQQPTKTTTTTRTTQTTTDTARTPTYHDGRGGTAPQPPTNARWRRGRIARRTGRVAHGTRRAAHGVWAVTGDAPTTTVKAVARASVHAQQARARVAAMAGKLDDAQIAWAVRTRHPSGTLAAERAATQERAAARQADKQQGRRT